nr:hypothetical protein [Clostridium sp. Marseille-P7770]
MKSLRILGRVTSAIMFVAIFMFKMMYYIGRVRSGWFTNGWCIPWISISLAISLAPMVCIFISSMMLKKPFSAVLQIVGGCLLAANLLFEGVSILGAAMCLDNDWMDICVQMMVCHILGVMALILGALGTKKRK